MKTTPNRKKRLHDRPRFRNGLSVIPSLFTIGNMFCGYYAIASTLQANYDYAAIAIGVIRWARGRSVRRTERKVSRASGL